MHDYRIILLMLAAILPSGVLGGVLDNSQPKSFEASYTLYKGNSEVGKAVLSLKTNEDSISWQLETEPTGLYALLTSKKPYSESVMQANAAEYNLASIFISFSRSDEPQESAAFDWQAKKVNVERKGKQKSVSLGNAVYDYLSIHWLSAQMTLNAGTKTEFDFYRKGKLWRATLLLSGQTQLELNEDNTKAVHCYQLTFLKSSRQYEFCYGHDNPFMPLKITRIKSGKKPSVLLFKKLK